MERFKDLLPEEREAIDTFAFAQSLIVKGGDVERRFALIALDNSLEVVLRAFLLKRGVDRKIVDEVRKLDEMLFRCEKAGLKVNDKNKIHLYEMHDKRNKIYHGKTVLLPTKRDLESWSEIVSQIIFEATNLNPFDYFRTKEYERISLLPEDLEYISRLERSFRRKAPYIARLTWWSEIQRDALEAGEKWDLYVHYRPRWPFFIPTLVLAKCNPYTERITKDHMVNLESKALFLKNEKKVWRVWLGIVSSNGFEKEAIERAEDYEGKTLGVVLVNPREKRFYASKFGQCKKAIKWLVLEM